MYKDGIQIPPGLCLACGTYVRRYLRSHVTEKKPCTCTKEPRSSGPCMCEVRLYTKIGYKFRGNLCCRVVQRGHEITHGHMFLKTCHLCVPGLIHMCAMTYPSYVFLETCHSCVPRLIHMCAMTYPSCGVATISRLLKTTGIFCRI